MGADGVPIPKNFTIDTVWKLNKKTAVTYPCSAGYSINFAANDNLLDDVLDAIDDPDLGGLKGCSRLCNINNGSYSNLEISGKKNLKGVLGKDTCEAVSGKFGFAEDACKCGTATAPGAPVTSIYGCKLCFAKVKFEVADCLDEEP